MSKTSQRKLSSSQTHNANININPKKIYHYTKGTCINSIFTDGFIATERKRGISKIAKNTDYVWLTEKAQFPKTALPYIGHMHETHLMRHMQIDSIYVDLDKVGEFIGGAYRFSFDSTDVRFKKWWFSNERNAVKNNSELKMMEMIANKVGDEARAFWISSQDISLEKFSLEVFRNGGWQMILLNATILALNPAELSAIESLKDSSKLVCERHGLPSHHILLAA